MLFENLHELAKYFVNWKGQQGSVLLHSGLYGVELTHVENQNLENPYWMYIIQEHPYPHNSSGLIIEPKLVAVINRMSDAYKDCKAGILSVDAYDRIAAAGNVTDNFLMRNLSYQNKDMLSVFLSKYDAYKFLVSHQNSDPT